MKQNCAIFFDRDGTLIPDWGYLNTVQGIVLLPGVVEAMKTLQQAGFLLIVISNQSGIGRGYFTPKTVQAQNRQLKRILKEAGVVLAAMDYCPHLPEANCVCRKPKPGMLLRAAQRFHLDLSRSYMIGDKTTDAIAGRTAGCRTVLLGSTLSSAADFTVDSISGATAWILRDATRNAGLVSSCRGKRKRNQSVWSG